MKFKCINYKNKNSIYYYNKDFKLGSKQFWEMSKNINSDDDDDEIYDPNKGGRKTGPKINVRKNRW